MKKTSHVTWMLVVGSVFLLSACGAATSSGTQNTAGAKGTPDALANTQPKEQAAIQGTVKSVTGNELTVETIDMSSDPLFQEMQSEDFRAKMQTMTDVERQAIMTKMQDARTKAKKILVDVTIPVGIPIMVRTGRGDGSRASGAGGVRMGGQTGATSNAGIGSSLGTTSTKSPATTTATSKEGTIADIKTGATISIWLTPNTGDRKIASWVSLSPSTAGQGETITGQGGGGENRPAGASRTQ